MRIIDKCYNYYAKTKCFVQGAQKSGGVVAYLQVKNVQSSIFTFANKNVKILYIIYFGKRGTPFGMMLHYVYIIPKQTMLETS